MDREIADLAWWPHRFPRAREATLLGRDVRHVPVGNYRVLFVVAGSAIHVLHVRHAARGPAPRGLR